MNVILEAIMIAFYFDENATSIQPFMEVEFGFCWCNIKCRFVSEQKKKWNKSHTTSFILQNLTSNENNCQVNARQLNACLEELYDVQFVHLFSFSLTFFSYTFSNYYLRIYLQFNIFNKCLKIKLITKFCCLIFFTSFVEIHIVFGSIRRQLFVWILFSSIS